MITPQDIPARIDNLRAEKLALYKRIAEIDVKLRSLEIAARVFSIYIVPSARYLDIVGSVRDRVIAALTEKGVVGVTVAELRPAFPGIHEKTLGTTLYRLKVAGEATRDGRRWFIYGARAA